MNINQQLAADIYFSSALILSTSTLDCSDSCFKVTPPLSIFPRSTSSVLAGSGVVNGKRSGTIAALFPAVIVQLVLFSSFEFLHPCTCHHNKETLQEERPQRQLCSLSVCQRENRGPEHKPYR